MTTSDATARVHSICQRRGIDAVGRARADRAQHLLAEPRATGADLPRLHAGGGLIEFDHVGFSYDERRPVLVDVSFRIEPGEHVALIGMPGAGKSSVMGYLAPRLAWGYVDLDQAVEARAGRSVAEIFASEGEERFRDLYLPSTRERRQEISVLFADLEGFTAFSERSSLAEVAGVLNAYWGAAVPLLTRQFGGEIEKFIQQRKQNAK